MAWRIRIPKLNLDLIPKSCKNTQNQVVWRVRIRKLRFPKINFASWVRGVCRHLVPRSCKYAVNQVAWRIKFAKLNLGLVPKSCKNTQNQVIWRIRIRKVRFPNLILHRGWDAFVDICLILFFRIRKLNLDLVPRSCKYAVNQRFGGSGSKNWI